MNGTHEITRADLAAMAETIPKVAAAAVGALVNAIPAYGPTVRGPEELADVEDAILLAIYGFFSAVEHREGESFGPDATTIDAAYAYGVYEAEHDRDNSALLAAYRIGTRVAWESMSDLLVQRKVAAGAIARFALLVFTYMDQISAASVAGHTAANAAEARMRDRRRGQLSHALVTSGSADETRQLAVLAGWPLPTTITVAALPAAQVHSALQVLDHRALVVPGELSDEFDDRFAVVLIPDAHRERRALVRRLEDRGGALGPTKPWPEARHSYDRLVRLHRAGALSSTAFVDADDHLVTLVVRADTEAFTDLRHRALAPLATASKRSQDRLTQTLRSWLLHNGSRTRVAEELGVHPQTVRYRVGQLRELFGDRLNDPNAILELTIALADQSDDIRQPDLGKRSAPTVTPFGTPRLAPPSGGPP